MRTGIDGLSLHGQQALGRPPCDGTAYVFANRRRTRLKLVCWDGTGVWMCCVACAWLAHIAHIGMARHIIPAETITAPAALSTRETEILQWVSTGLTSQLIADKLRVTKATVDRHMEAVRSKLHAENKVDAVVKAIRWGLI
jgi:DNA-binding CsgD family transcriptional regulator